MWNRFPQQIWPLCIIVLVFGLLWSTENGVLRLALLRGQVETFHTCKHHNALHYGTCTLDLNDHKAGFGQCRTLSLAVKPALKEEVELSDQPSDQDYPCAQRCTYLSAMVPIMPTRWVFVGCRHYCLLCAHCVSRCGEYVGDIRKALGKGNLQHLGLHAVLTICLRFSSILDTARVACCLFLSTDSYRVCTQIYTSCCCFTFCATKAFGAQEGSLWGCKVGAGASAWQPGKKGSYYQVTVTCAPTKSTTF